MKRLLLLALAACLPLLGSCQPMSSALPTRGWDHIVVLWEENRSADEVRDLPYIRALRASGTTFTQSFAVARPSQPNYIAFFSGSTQGVISDSDHDITAPNLATVMAAAGLEYISYAQGLPSVGWRGSVSGAYRRKHNPAVSSTNVSPSAIRPFSDFPSDYAALPAFSFVVPDQDHDMHDGTPELADQWLSDNLGAYVEWAKTHNSLFILSFDEPSTAAGVDVASTPILTVAAGQGIAPGTELGGRVDHYGMLAYVLGCFGLEGRLP